MNSRHYLLIVFVLLCLVAQFMKPEGSIARMAETDRAQLAAVKLREDSAAPQQQASTQTGTASQPSDAPLVSAAQLWAADTTADDVRDNPDPEDEPIEIADYQPELVGPPAFNPPTSDTPDEASSTASIPRKTGRLLSDNRSPEEFDSSVPFDPVVG